MGMSPRMHNWFFKKQNKVIENSWALIQFSEGFTDCTSALFLFSNLCCIKEVILLVGLNSKVILQR